jgi:hypothetical protein
MRKFAQMLSPCRESLIWNFSVRYAVYGGATQCLFKTFSGIRPFTMANLPLPGPVSCGMVLAGRRWQKNPWTSIPTTSTNQELARAGPARNLHSRP